MDVTESRLRATSPPPAAPPGPHAGAGGVSLPAPSEANAKSDDDPSPATAIWDAPWVPRSTLKMALSSADVAARFEIDEETSRVTVTMYDRRSGEVLRQLPPEDLQEVIRAVAGRGMIVDVES